MMLESALTDIKEAPPGGLANLSQQALWLLRLLQDFLCAEGHGNQELWSEKVRLFGGVGATRILCPYNLRVSSLGDGRVHRACLVRPSVMWTTALELGWVYLTVRAVILTQTLLSL